MINNTYLFDMLTNCNQADWKSVALALAVLFVVRATVKYFNARRVSAYKFPMGGYACEL
jgi:hypothetical protein